jgi:hypothetical protein
MVLLKQTLGYDKAVPPGVHSAAFVAGKVLHKSAPAKMRPIHAICSFVTDAPALIAGTISDNITFNVCYI